MSEHDSPWVEVANFATPFEAHLARGLLEAEGLRATIADEHLVSANAALTYAIGGVKLLVRAAHGERALAILAARQRGEYAIDEGHGEGDGEARVAALLRIHGRVQGVAFRAAMQAQAESLAVAGWVRNRRDGSVEALVGGSAQGLERLIRWAQNGPPSARVERVEREPADPPDGAAFEIRPTV